MDSTILEINNVSKTFGKKTILNGITFSVNEGEIFGFLGPNGSGKTTTIKMILGLLRVDDGQIIVCGRNVVTDFENAVKHIGGIIENPEMYKNLTGRENLMQYKRMYDNIPDSRVDEVIKIVGLEGRIDDKISKYSLGMRQRLGIAQSMLHNPKLLVLDEPTNGLDPDGIKQLRDIFKRITRENACSVLVSSHMLAELDLMCDRIAIIDRGKIVDIRSMSEIRHVSSDASVEYELDCGDSDIGMFLNMKNMPFTVHENGHTAVMLKKTDVPEFVKSLVEQGITLYSLVPKTRTLEDAYMEKTSHNVPGGVGV